MRFSFASLFVGNFPMNCRATRLIGAGSLICFDLRCNKQMQKELSLEQRLDVIRKTDHLRRWASLDDERVCVVCEKIFKGRQIKIDRDQRGYYLLHCPTEGCPSSAAHWFYVGSRPAAKIHRVDRQHQLRAPAAA